jgi:2'-5' RNA ligase
MRIFAALIAADDFIGVLKERLYPVKENHPDFRWTPQENIHLTLAFLGEMSRDAVSALTSVVENVAGLTEKIRVGAGGLLFLPNRTRPNVLALGFEYGAVEIAALAERLADGIGCGCADYSFVRERAFKPHITLARKGKTPLRLSPGEMGVCFGVNGLVETIAVVKSDLYRDGPIYTRLAAFSLKGGKPTFA